MGVPFYLQPTTTENDSSSFDIVKATSWTYDYDYGKTPEPANTTSFWESIVEADKQAGQYIWDTAKGTWDTAKSVATGAVQTVKDIGSAVETKAFSTIDSVFVRVGLVFAVLVAGIWIIAKTGILGDVAKIVSLG